jgi:hypothetical protein
MPLQKIQFKPGINREGTSLANEGGWFDGDKIRFRSGYPEKIGGWTVGTYAKFLGVCRSLWNWVTLGQYNLLGMGTNLKFYIESGGLFNDITPIRLTTTNATYFQAAFTTLSSTMTATQTTVPLTSGTNFSTVGGIVKIGTEQIQYAAVVSNTLTNCIRGFNNTTPAAHTTGANVGCSTLVVTAATAGNIQPNDFVTFAQAISLGGNIVATVLNQEYQIIGQINATTYTVNARAVPATGVEGTLALQTPLVFSSVTDTGNGGTGPATTLTDAAYQISTGNNNVTIGTGWGAGPWNAGSITDAWAHGWGTGFTTGIALALRLWNQVNFGQTLLFAPRKGPLYYWDPSGGVGSVAPVFSRGALASSLVGAVEVPSEINFFTVSDATRIVICFGCTSYSFDSPATTYDPMLIRWSEQESYIKWSPSALNQAGSYRLSHGSEIVSALQTRQEILVWTDSAIYSMQYLGPPYIWGFNLLADNISIMSQNAMATAAGATYWMGADKFYAYTGRVETLPCSVRQYVFNDLNRNQAGQIFAGTSEGYNEIWWFYPSITGPDNTGTVAAPNQFIDRYVIFNHLDKVWYYGTLPRTAWLDSGLRISPMATTLDNLLVYHEQGTDDGSTNPPSPITSYIQTSLFDIEDGDHFSFVWRMVPDVTFDGSTTGAPAYPTVNMALIPKQAPGAVPGYGPNPSVTSTESYAQRYTYKVQEFTEIVYTRVRGRQLTFQISSDTRGTAWQLGVPTIDIRKDGRR